MSQGPSLISVLKRRWLPAVAVLATTVGASLVYLAVAKSEYAVTARLIVDDRSVSISELGQELSASRVTPPGDANPLATEAELVRSQTVIERAIALLKENGLPADDLIAEDIAEDIDVAIIPATNILEVSYATEQVGKAAAILNAILQASTEQSAEAIRSEASAVRAFLEAEVPQLQAQLAAAETAESEYRQQSGLISSEVQTDGLIATLSDLAAVEQALNADLVGVISRERQLRQITNVGSLSEAYAAVQVGQNAELQGLRQDLIALENEVIDARSRLGDQHPDLLALLDRRNDTLALYARQVGLQAPNAAVNQPRSLAADPLSQDLLSQLVASEVARSEIESRLASVRQERNRLSGQLYDLPAQQKPLATLLRKKAEGAASLELLQNKLEEARLAEAQLIGNLRIIDKAVTPTAAEWPQPIPILFLGLVAGSVLATGIVLLLEVLDDSVHSLSEVESLTQLPILGTLPKLPQHALHLDIPENFLGDPVLVEPYRMLLQNITLRNTDRCQVVVVSSAGADEGKSVVTSHLAAVSSLLLRRTLIIDMDLRRPKQFSTFNQPPLPGVTTTVSGQNTPLEAIQATRLENLWILPHGNAAEQPSVVLEQVIQSGLIKQIAQHFDYIFIDTPPISSCADAVMLGQQSDGLVLVARADFTPSITLQQVANRLKSSGVSLLGAVMNSTQTNTDTYYQQQPPASSNGNGNGNGSKSRAFYSIGRQK